MTLLRHIEALNTFDPARFRPFFVGEDRVGWVRHDFAETLKDYPKVFTVGEVAVALTPPLATPQARTRALAEVVEDLGVRGLMQKKRNEPYAITNTFGETPYFTIDRVAVSHFGLKAYGVHMNGYVRTGEGLKMWIARRAKDRIIEPGKLDNMVAGGQPAGLSLRDNLIKECAEEAGIPKDLAERAIPVGAVSYLVEGPKGAKPDCMFCYDLELPPDFTPVPQDGEVEKFILMPAAQALEIVRATGDFKFNVNLVVIDFAIRHGILDPDEEPDYEALVTGVRRLTPAEA